MEPTRPQQYRSWLVGEAMLVGLLASTIALFAVSDWLEPSYVAPEARLVMDTAIAVVAAIVAVLAAIRFVVEGRLSDLLLAGGFWSVALGASAFVLASLVGADSLPAEAAWGALGPRVLGAALIASAPFASARSAARRRLLALAGSAVTLAVAALWLPAAWTRSGSGTAPVLVEGPSIVLVATALSCLWLVALGGFALRFRRFGRDLDAWIALAATLAFFADLHLALAPAISSDAVLQGDFLRLVAFAILLVGVWRAIAEAEFGRAVADERARVAREIHDGLAQYLFAIATQVSMLRSGAELDQILPRLEEASVAAQREARFAVLALSSASGTARFDASLRRYVEVLTADGALDVDVEVDPRVRLAPDEQIEVFRIVQEGLGNVRRHARARRAVVEIGQVEGRRTVVVRDDGVGFDERVETGQGLENMRRRAEAIDGTLRVRSAPGRGTSLEVVLRPA